MTSVTFVQVCKSCSGFYQLSGQIVTSLLCQLEQLQDGLQANVGVHSLFSLLYMLDITITCTMFSGSVAAEEVLA